MGSHMAVYTGSSKAELSDERRVSRCGKNLGFMKDSRRLGWPCWSSKGNQTSTSCLPFCLLFIFPSTRFFFFIHLDIWVIYFIYSLSPLAVHLSISDLSSNPSPNSRALTPPRQIPLLRRLTSRNSSAISDRVTRCSARPSACVRGCRVPKSPRWGTKRIEWTKMMRRQELPRALLYQCGRSTRMA